MYAEITKSIEKAAQIIKDGRVVAFPTGTSYGFAVDTLQGYALQRLRNLKHRPGEKTFTVFMDPSLWPKFLKLTEEEKRILTKAHRQPLTLLVEPLEDLEHLAQDGRIGLRVIDHYVMEALAQAVDVPLTATSANIAGEEPCNSVECIEKKFPGRIDETTYNLSLGAILDGGELPKQPPTTIAKFGQGHITIIRAGQLTESALEKFF